MSQQGGADPFYGDISQGESPFVHKDDHAAIGLHVPGENLLAPERAIDCVSGDDGTPGLSDALCREDHTHNVRARIMDHVPDDTDFTDPKPGIIVFDELDGKVYMRGTVEWFSWDVTVV